MPTAPSLPQRNMWGVRSDELMCAIVPTAGSGTTLTCHAATRHSLGDWTTTGGTWGSDSDGPYFDFSGGGGSGFAKTAALASELIVPNLTIAILFKDVPNVAANKPLVVTAAGAGSGFHGAITAFRASSSTNLTFQYRDDTIPGTRAGTHASTTFTNLNVLVLQAGANGVKSWLNGTINGSVTNNSDTYTGFARTASGGSWYLGKNNATGNVGDYKLYGFLAWKCLLTTRERNLLLGDFYNPMREPPGKSAVKAAVSTWSANRVYSYGDLVKPSAASEYVFENSSASAGQGYSGASEPTWNEVVSCRTTTEGTIRWKNRTPTIFVQWTNPVMGRRTTTGVSFLATTHWRLPSGITAYARVKLASTITGLDAAAVAASGSASTARTAIWMNVTGLTAGTTYYWRAEWSTNGSTWYPFPGGPGELLPLANGRTALWGDQHINVGAGGILPDDIGHLSDIIFLDDGSVSGFAYRNRYAASRSVRYLATQDHVAHFIMGDHLMCDNSDIEGTDDVDCEMWQSVASWACANDQALKLAPMYFIPGNHEGMCGYHQTRSDNLVAAACQKRATIVWKLCIPNPDDGETGSEWISSTTPTAYVVDSGGVNLSPLQNYFTVTIGNTQFFCVDCWRYTDIGSTTEYRTIPANYTLGATQTQWLRAQLAQSTATNKIILAHNLPGGIYSAKTANDDNGTLVAYARGSYGDQYQSTPFTTDGIVRSASQDFLAALSERYGAHMLFGHDHMYTKVVKRTVYGIHLPSMGAPTHTQGNGLQYSRMRNSHGTAESLGALDHDGNSMVSRGIEKHLNIVGVTCLTLGASNVVAETVETIYTTSGSGEAAFYTPSGSTERFKALETATPDASKEISLVDSLNPSPDPEDVYQVSPVGTYDANGTYSGGSTDYYGPHNAATWSGGLVLAAGGLVVPTVPTGWLYRCDAGGTLDATTEPTYNGTAATDWPVVLDGGIVNGTATLVAVQRIGKYKHEDELNGATIALAATAPSTVYPVWTPRIVDSVTLSPVTPNAQALSRWEGKGHTKYVNART